MPNDPYDQYDPDLSPQEGEEYDEEEYIREQARLERRRRAFRTARNFGEAEGTRRAARYYWRNRRRIRRASQLHWQFAKRNFKQKQSVRTANYFWRNRRRIRRASKLYLQFGKVAVLPEIAGAVGAVAGVIAVIFLFSFFVLFLGDVFRQETTGGAYVPGIPGSGPPGGPFGPPVDVQVSKTVTPDKIELNTATQVTYTVEVLNNLEEPLENLVFLDALASGVPCEINGATLGSGESASCSYRYNIEAQSQPTRIINDVTIVGVSGGVEHLGSASATVIVGEPPVDAPCGYPAQGRFTQGCQASHAPDLATDIAAAEGVTPVIATMSGSGKRVVLTTRQGDRLGSGRSGSYGVYVWLENENYWTLYGHLYPEPGDVVGQSRDVSFQKGDRIGYVGNTGNSSGPHLHYEIKRNGNRVCPHPIGTPSLFEDGSFLDQTILDCQVPQTQPAL